MSGKYIILLIRLMLSNRLVQFVIATITAVLMLSGCAISSTERPSLDFCQVYEPVLFDSANDTPETIDAIMQNNVLWAQFCDATKE